MESETLLWSMPEWTGHLDIFEQNVGAWERRFCLLQGPFLFYFQNELDRSRPLGVLGLEGSKIEEKVVDPTRKHGFVITVGPQYAALGKYDQYNLATTSADSLKRAIRRLKNAADAPDVLVDYLDKTWGRAGELRSLLAKSPNDKKALGNAKGVEAQAVKTELVKTYVEMENLLKKVDTKFAEADQSEKDLGKAEILQDMLNARGDKSKKDALLSNLQKETKITRDLTHLLQKKSNYLQGQGLEDLTQESRNSLRRMLRLALQAIHDRHAKIHAEAPRYSFPVDARIYKREQPSRKASILRRNTGYIPHVQRRATHAASIFYRPVSPPPLPPPSNPPVARESVYSPPDQALTPLSPRSSIASPPPSTTSVLTPLKSIKSMFKGDKPKPSDSGQSPSDRPKVAFATPDTQSPRKSVIPITQPRKSVIPVMTPDSPSPSPRKSVIPVMTPGSPSPSPRKSAIPVKTPDNPSTVSFSPETSQFRPASPVGSQLTGSPPAAPRIYNPSLSLSKQTPPPPPPPPPPPTSFSPPRTFSPSLSIKHSHAQPVDAPPVRPLANSPPPQENIPFARPIAIPTRVRPPFVTPVPNVSPSPSISPSPPPNIALSPASLRGKPPSSSSSSAASSPLQLFPPFEFKVPAIPSVLPNQQDVTSSSSSASTPRFPVPSLLRPLVAPQVVPPPPRTLPPQLHPSLGPPRMVSPPPRMVSPSPSYQPPQVPTSSSIPPSPRPNPSPPVAPLPQTTVSPSPPRPFTAPQTTPPSPQVPPRPPSQMHPSPQFQPSYRTVSPSPPSPMPPPPPPPEHPPVVSPSPQFPSPSSTMPPPPSIIPPSSHLQPPQPRLFPPQLAPRMTPPSPQPSLPPHIHAFPVQPSPNLSSSPFRPSQGRAPTSLPPSGMFPQSPSPPGLSPPRTPSPSPSPPMPPPSGSLPQRMPPATGSSPPRMPPLPPPGSSPPRMPPPGSFPQSMPPATGSFPPRMPPPPGSSPPRMPPPPGSSPPRMPPPGLFPQSMPPATGSFPPRMPPPPGSSPPRMPPPPGSSPPRMPPPPGSSPPRMPPPPGSFPPRMVSPPHGQFPPSSLTPPSPPPGSSPPQMPPPPGSSPPRMPPPPPQGQFPPSSLGSPPPKLPSGASPRSQFPPGSSPPRMAPPSPPSSLVSPPRMTPPSPSPPSPPRPSQYLPPHSTQLPPGSSPPRMGSPPPPRMVSPPRPLQPGPQTPPGMGPQHQSTPRMVHPPQSQFPAQMITQAPPSSYMVPSGPAGTRPGAPQPLRPRFPQQPPAPPAMAPSLTPPPSRALTPSSLRPVPFYKPATTMEDIRSPSNLVRPLRRTSSSPPAIDPSATPRAAPPPPPPLPTWRPRPQQPFQIMPRPHGQPQSPPVMPETPSFDQRSRELLDAISFSALNILKHIITQAELYSQQIPLRPVKDLHKVSDVSGPSDAQKASKPTDEIPPHSRDENFRCDGAVQTLPELRESAIQTEAKAAGPDQFSSPIYEQAQGRTQKIIPDQGGMQPNILEQSGGDQQYLGTPAGLQPLPILKPPRRRQVGRPDYWPRGHGNRMQYVQGPATRPYAWRGERSPRRRRRWKQQERVDYYPDEEYFDRRQYEYEYEYEPPQQRHEPRYEQFQEEEGELEQPVIKPRTPSPAVSSRSTDLSPTWSPPPASSRALSPPPASSSRSVVSSRNSSASSTDTELEEETVTASTSAPGISIDFTCTYEFDIPSGRR